VGDEFDTHLISTDGQVIVLVRGEVDIATADQFRDALLAAYGRG
jgi:hypothetical protein